jgi:hypothetical protein
MDAFLHGLRVKKFVVGALVKLLLEEVFLINT